MLPRLLQADDVRMAWAGIFSMGVVLTEAMHVFSLNFAAALILPRVGALVPMVVPCIVITTIRSPFSIAPGPALNLIPATAGAILHGGLEAWRAHALGCGLGMLMCYLVEKRLRMLQAHEFTSAWSAKAFIEGDNGQAPAKRVTRASKKAEDFVARKKANEDFDPNAMASGDFVIKGITAHRFLFVFLPFFSTGVTVRLRACRRKRSPIKKDPCQKQKIPAVARRGLVRSPF